MKPLPIIDSYKAAIIQHPPVFLNLAASLDKADALITEAAGRGAKVIVFPECWLPGYPLWLDLSPKAALWDYPPAKALYRILAENSIIIPGPHFDALRAMAARAGVYVVMGAHQLLGSTIYNTMVYLDKDGEDFRLHRKLIPTYTERLVWGRGDGSTLNVLKTDYGIIGGLICWEHWMPLARAAMHDKRETIHVAQWPWVRELHQLASRHYAFEGGCFVLAAGCVITRGEVIDGLDSLGHAENAARELLEQIPGNNTDLILKGGSAIIGPDTEYLAEPLYNKVGIVEAEIKPQRQAESKMYLDTAGHYSRPDVFHLEVCEKNQPNVTWSSPETKE
ncbi:carbon-nitrogen hydrolase family protein [Candidatus Zixiibacteriota bacterium]